MRDEKKSAGNSSYRVERCDIAGAAQSSWPKVVCSSSPGDDAPPVTKDTISLPANDALEGISSYSDLKNVLQLSVLSQKIYRKNAVQRTRRID